MKGVGTGGDHNKLAPDLAGVIPLYLQSMVIDKARRAMENSHFMDLQIAVHLIGFRLDHKILAEHEIIDRRLMFQRSFDSKEPLFILSGEKEGGLLQRLRGKRPGI